MKTDEVDKAISERYAELVGSMEVQLCGLCDCYKDGATDEE